MPRATWCGGMRTLALHAGAVAGAMPLPLLFALLEHAPCQTLPCSFLPLHLAAHPTPTNLSAVLQLDSSEEWRAATTEEQRETFSSQLTEAEDWLYGDGEAVDVAEYRWTRGPGCSCQQAGQPGCSCQQVGQPGCSCQQVGQPGCSCHKRQPGQRRARRNAQLDPFNTLSPPSIHCLPAAAAHNRSKLRKLKQTGDAIATRVAEAKQRPQVRPGH